MGIESNLGRMQEVKRAFNNYLQRGVDGVVPNTIALESYKARERELRVGMVAGRMVDRAEEYVKQYTKSGNGLVATPSVVAGAAGLNQDGIGINAPLPIILVAFAQENMTQSGEAGRVIADPFYSSITEQGSEIYKVRMDAIEKLVQVAFIAHEVETVNSLCSQMRLYVCQYQNLQFDVNWLFGGNAFTTTASFDRNAPFPAEEKVELDERTNIVIITWNLLLRVQLPYVEAPEPYTFVGDVVAGYDKVREVDVTITSQNKTETLRHGTINIFNVDNQVGDRIGDWEPRWDGKTVVKD